MAHRIYLPALQALRQQLATLDAQRQKVVHAIAAIEDLPDPPEDMAKTTQSDATTLFGKSTEDSPSYADATASILKETGEPMHIDEITRAAKDRGWYSDKDFSERTDKNSFIGGLDRNARNGRLFYKPAPATYALLAWKNGKAETEQEPQATKGRTIED